VRLLDDVVAALRDGADRRRAGVRVEGVRREVRLALARAEVDATGGGRRSLVERDVGQMLLLGSQI
jgi:hypothetical protein